MGQDLAQQTLVDLLNPAIMNGGRTPFIVTDSYAMRKTDGWVVVAPAAAAGTITIQLPFDPDPGSMYYVTRDVDAVVPSTVDVVVIGNFGGGVAGDTLYSVLPANGGYHISRQNETVAFFTNIQQQDGVPRPYTDWYAVGGLGLESYSSPFVPNLAGPVFVPLAGFGPGNRGGDGGHPRTLYGLSIAVAPALSAGQLGLAPFFNGVSLSGGFLDLTPATQPAASRVTATSPCAGPGVSFGTPQPGGLLFRPPSTGGVLEALVIGSDDAAGPTSGIVTAFVF